MMKRINKTVEVKGDKVILEDTIIREASEVQLLSEIDRVAYDLTALYRQNEDLKKRKLELLERKNTLEDALKQLRDVKPKDDFDLD